MNMEEKAPGQEKSLAPPKFSDAIRFWLKLGFISFGGPAGQIAIMHTELVEKRRWIGEERFLHALNFCMILPGPEAQQLCIYIGWLLHRTWGGILAGVLFVLPSALLLWVLSVVYVSYGTVPWIAAIFYGFKPAVLALVMTALLRIAKRTLKTKSHCAIALMAFIALIGFSVPFPIILIAAGMAGFLGSKFGSSVASEEIIPPVLSEPSDIKPGFLRSLRILSTCLVLWWAPILAAGLILGWSHTIFREGMFFSKAAMVTFGGAYAVLPYVSQQAVESYGWLSSHQMLDGLALAETTPGPLIIVLQFVGFLGAWNHPGDLNPLLAASLGAAISTWATFVPSFLWIFLGAPHIEKLRGNKALSATLASISAAVTGVILNLLVWIAWSTILPNKSGSVDYFAILLAVTCFLLLTRTKTGVIGVMIFAAGSGLLLNFLTGNL